MSLSNSFRFLDVRKLTTKDIIDVIKNDELFSSCCKIIEEKELNGQDILNLSEKQILAWRPPQWLVKNLLSLKSSLSKNPETFLNPQRDYTVPNMRKESIKIVTNKLATLLKPENEADNNYLSFDAKDENEAFYDENNYLEPTVINPSLKMKKGFGKPPRKFSPSTESNSTQLKNRLDRSKSPSFRNPIPSPREDIEENVYEPAPNSSETINTRLRTQISVEDDYEPPPILPHKFRNQDTPRFYSNNKEIEDDFAPPLPVRTLTLQKQIKKEYNPQKVSNYTNVKYHSSEEHTTHENTANKILSKNIQSKYRQSQMKDEPIITPIPEASKDQKSWTSERPLPPIPRRNSINESIGKELQDEKMANEALKYYSLRKTSFPPDILRKIGNIDKSSVPLQSDFLQEMRRSPSTPQVHQVSKNNDLSNSNGRNYDGLSEVNNNHEGIKPAISNSNLEHKSNSNLLSEIFKVKLRSTKSPVQIDKTPNNDDIHKTFSKLTETEEVKKPFKVKQPFTSTGKTISSTVNSLISTSETKFRSSHTTVFTKENSVERSATENESMVEYINMERQRSEVHQTSASVHKNKIQKTNILNTNINSIPRKVTVPSENNFSEDENIGELPEYINQDEKLLQNNSPVDLDMKIQASMSASPRKTTIQNSNQSIFSDLSSKISAVKLKPTNFPAQKIPISQDDMVDDDEILPEYSNNEELRKLSESKPVAPTKWNKTIQNINTHNNVRELNAFVPEVDSQEANPLTGINQFSSDENGDEDQPEYGNLSEIKKSAQPSNDGSKFKSSTAHQPVSQPKSSQLLSEISKLKLTPKNYAALNDTAAEDLRRKLLELKKGNPEDQKKTVPSNNYTSKPHVKLASPPTKLPTDFSDTTRVSKDSSDSSEDDPYDDLYNLNNEKFYRNTDRKGAKALLKGLGDGAFVLRPSREKKFYLSITIKNKNKYYNFGIRKSAKEYIFCGEGDMKTPEFISIRAFLEYYEKYPFVLLGDGGIEHVYLKKLLTESIF